MQYTTSYISGLKDILQNGYWYPDPNREGVKRKEVFGATIYHDMEESFPMLTTKPIWLRGVWEELKWMLSGNTNAAALAEKNISIWTKDAYNHWQRNANEDLTYDEFETLIKSNSGHMSENGMFPGELGRIYGEQWRDWKRTDGGNVDQINNLLSALRGKGKYGSAHIISAWNPGELDQMALKPCHHEMQFNVRPSESGKEYLDLNFTMRSSDFLLGQPWNMAFYGLLLILFAEISGYRPGILTYTGRKTHLYNNQLDSAREQINKFEKLTGDGKEFLQEPTYVGISEQLQSDILDYRNNRLSFNGLLMNTDVTAFNLSGYKNAGKLKNRPEMLSYTE